MADHMTAMTAMTAEQLREDLADKAQLYRSQALAMESLADDEVAEILDGFADCLEGIAARLSGMAADGLSALPVLAYDAGNDARIEVARQPYCTTKWKVSRSGNVLAHDGQWEWEPMPSSRDAAFLRRCRFDTPQDALACLKAAPEPPHV